MVDLETKSVLWEKSLTVNQKLGFLRFLGGIGKETNDSVVDSWDNIVVKHSQNMSSPFSSLDTFGYPMRHYQLPGSFVRPQTFFGLKGCRACCSPVAT